jgi:serine/threonine protein kinase
LNKQVPVSTRSDVFSFGMVVVEAFTGKPPFHKISSTAAAVCVLSGERPTRPARQDLTNDLWEITKRCWHWNSQCRPDVTEVVHCLRNTVDLRNGHIDVDDDRATDNTSSESVPQEGSLIRLRPRPPRWTPVSYVLRQLYKIGRFSPASRVASDADDAQHVEDEKPIVRRHQASGTPKLLQRARCFFSGHNAFRRSQPDYKRSKTKSTVIQDSAVPSLNRSHSHVMSFKIFRARSS